MEVRVARSAFKHGCTEDQILHAFNHAIFSDELDDDMVMLVGGEPNGLLLEVGVVTATDGTPVIVHAMVARTKFLR